MTRKLHSSKAERNSIQPVEYAIKDIHTLRYIIGVYD